MDNQKQLFNEEWKDINLHATNDNDEMNYQYKVINEDLGKVELRALWEEHKDFGYLDVPNFNLINEAQRKVFKQS